MSKLVGIGTRPPAIMQYPEELLANTSLKKVKGGLFNNPNKMGPSAFGSSDIMQLMASPGTQTLAAWNAESDPEQSDPNRRVLFSRLWKILMRLRSMALIAASNQSLWNSRLASNNHSRNNTTLRMQHVGYCLLYLSLSIYIYIYVMCIGIFDLRQISWKQPLKYNSKARQDPR